MWKALNQPLFGTSKPTVFVQWSEPYLCRLRLHRDYLTRLWLAFAEAVALASLFFVAGFAETKDVSSGLIAAGFGFFFLGSIAALAVLFAPEAAFGSKVEILENQIRRTRSTFQVYGVVRTKEVWDAACLSGSYVLSQDLGTNFTVLLLPIRSQRGNAIVCVPDQVDLVNLLNHLQTAGANLERVSHEHVERYPPFSRLWIVAISTLATIAFAAAIAAAITL